MTLVPITPPKPKHPPIKPPVSIETLDVASGAVMVMGRYAPHEYCADCVEPILKWNSEVKHRSISVYEILTAFREYRCSTCNRPLWDPNRKSDD